MGKGRQIGPSSLRSKLQAQMAGLVWFGGREEGGCICQSPELTEDASLDGSTHRVLQGW